jgi:hypothetical protein
MIARFFKYTSSESARKVLKDKRLRCSSPDSFHDPFGLKNPLEQETKLDYLRRQAAKMRITLVSCNTYRDEHEFEMASSLELGFGAVQFSMIIK